MVLLKKQPLHPCASANKVLSLFTDWGVKVMILKIGRYELVGLSKAAQMLGITRQSLWRAIKKGELDAVSIGKYTLVDLAKAKEWHRRYFPHPKGRAAKASGTATRKHAQARFANLTKRAR